MTSLYGYRVFYSGVVLLVFSYGVCVLAEEKTALERRAAAGSSLILPLGYPKDSVFYAEWKYKEQSFAIYRNKTKQFAITNVLQFSGRLKVNSDDLSVEVMNLQLRDSGSYTIVSEKSPGDQHPTETIILTVYDVVKVEIKSEQTWKAATNSCDVSLLCRAPEDQTVSYRWSGFMEKNGAQLNFTLKPEDGDVTLNCSASGSTGNGSKTSTVKCTPEKPTIEDNHDINMQVIYIAAAGGGAALLLIFAITGLTCWWKSHKEQDLADPGSTVYEDVNVEGTLRKQSINIASIYETVDEHRIPHDKPQTLYDKVTFARPPPSLPSMPLPASQYQHVL